MEFKHGEEGAKGWFQLSNQDEVLARMTYSRVDSNYVIIDHTASSPDHRGEGYGKEIVHRMVEWARENDQKIMPLCPYAKKVIEADRTLQDVLKK